jgi:hypothetical protein
MIIVYSGNKFDIEFIEFGNGKSEAEEFYNGLSEKDKVGIYKLFMALGNNGFIKSKTHFIYEGDKIYAFKNEQVRFLCFFTNERKVVITHGFIKKQDKIPANEKEKALKVKKLYEKG